MNCIIYKQDNGVLAVTFPVQDMSREELVALAKKVTPTGKKFKIIDRSDLPSDTANRNAWTVDDSELTDGVGELLLE